MFNITETNELIRYFEETPYARSAGSNELNQEMLARILNDNGYDGILDVDEIKVWVDKHSDKNAYIWKDIVHRKVKLDSNFDPTVNQEATKFIQKHGYEKILDKNETNIDCIMLVEDENIATDRRFLNQIKKQGYKPNDVKVKDEDVQKLCYLNKMT